MPPPTPWGTPPDGHYAIIVERIGNNCSDFLAKDTSLPRKPYLSSNTWAAVKLRKLCRKALRELFRPPSAQGERFRLEDLPLFTAHLLARVEAIQCEHVVALESLRATIFSWIQEGGSIPQIQELLVSTLRLLKTAVKLLSAQCF